MRHVRDEPNEHFKAACLFLDYMKLPRIYAAYTPDPIDLQLHLRVASTLERRKANKAQSATVVESFICD